MRGQPVWLASLSRRSPLTGRPVATGLWVDQTRQEAIATLRQVLGPAGNRERERIFRMNVTMCIHRALTDDELMALPAYFHEAEATDLAGGPIEILWESEAGQASTQPCHAPIRQDLGYGDPLLWVPLDCGQCPPCLARAGLDPQMGAKQAALQVRLGAV